ncbi:TetR family transcriptional regulator [Curvivirga aplysinae]|uniref:TetR family transcriptional regulator n=1 Tax=Curvivirga aplysinae TaxID=2529852 RepID=UPI0012BD8057|nr:TetR family transcriptional regulator [Curvivirga aplysinae]MTI10855.1 TetR family transcriptional regulator [Curvivirga aplysinae]
MATQPQKKRTREPQEVRRAALINATLEVVAEHGLSNVTSQKVAAAANMTAAMVNFHFSGKTALLHATLKFVADEFIETHKKALEEAGNSPQEQLTSLVNTSLSELLFDHRKTALWYAFYSESRSREDYTRICEEHDEAYYAAYYAPIEALCAAEDRPMNPRAITLGIIGIMEHASQTLLVNPDYDRETSIEESMNFLKSVFSKW